MYKRASKSRAHPYITVALIPLSLAHVEASSPQMALSTPSTLKNNMSPSPASSIAIAEVPQSSSAVSAVKILPKTFWLFTGFIELKVPGLLEIELYASET